MGLAKTSVIVVFGLLSLSPLRAQQVVEGAGANSAPTARMEDSPGAILAWTPPSLAILERQAEVRNSFVLDRTTLAAMAAFLPQPDERVRPAIRKLDAISVHLYRFHDFRQIDSAELEQVREDFRTRGWKHMVSGNGHANPDSKTTDLWLVMDGIDVRGGAMMVVTPRTVSLITFTGNLSLVDMLHLRGHFGIPAASSGDADKIK